MQCRDDIPNIRKVSRYCYYICIILGVLTLAFTAIIKILHINVYKILPPCYFNKRFGYYCFGCGGTRALVSLAHGNIFASFMYHPFVIYAIFIYVVFMISNILSRLTKGRIRAFMFNPIVFYIGAIVIVVQCIAKNCILYINGSCI